MLGFLLALDLTTLFYVLDPVSGNPFQLRRTLEKITFLTRHISSLISFALSSRIQRVLQYRMSISTVPPGQARTIKLPTSQEKWQSILEAAYNCPYPTTRRRDWWWKVAGELLKTFQSEDCVCPLHCECGLIQYLETKRSDIWDNIPPLGYIGVSKFSCNACFHWIEAFNGLGGRRFYIGGLSGKWCWPWGMPMIEESLAKVMVRKVSGEYLAYEDLRFISEMRQRHHLPAAEREPALAEMDEEMKKYSSLLEFYEAMSL